MVAQTSSILSPNSQLFVVRATAQLRDLCRNQSLQTFASFIFLAAVLISVMSGQTTLTPQPTQRARSGGSIHGVVKDQSGAILPGAEVTLSGEAAASRTTKASTDGVFTFRGIAPGDYTISTDFKGLQQAGVVLVSVKGNEAITANVQMEVATQREQITVTETNVNQVSTEAANNASALVLRQEDLDALPDDPDDLAADLEALAGPSAGPGGNQIFIDGFTGGRLPPKSSIREVRINSNPFSSEYDKLGFGRIEIFTKPGSDKFHGQGYFGTSEGIWNSRNPFLSTQPSFQTQLFGGNISGPLGRKASFFVDVDRRNIDDNGIINATVPLTGLLGTQSYQNFYPTPQRRTTISPRADFQLTPNNTLSMRYAYLENDQLLTGIGNFNLPATTFGTVSFNGNGYSQYTNEHMLQLVDTAVLSPRVLNETHFQYARDEIVDASQSTTPQLNVTSSFVAGGSGYSSPGYGSTYDVQSQYELQNYTSVTAGSHTMKFGLRIRGDDLRDYSPKNFNGTYTFQGGSTGISSIEQYLQTLRLLNSGLTSAQVTALGFGPSLYTVSSGNPATNFAQIDLGPFFQDDWRVRPNLTLSMGLRWEVQNNISDKADWAPRFGIAWSPDAGRSGGRPKTVVRAGWGTFYDRFQALNVLNAYRYNGENQINYVIENPTLYNAAFSTTPVLNSSDVSNAVLRYQIDGNLRAPRVMQAVIGVERQLTKSTKLSFNFMNSRGVHMLRTVDINAPLPGTYTYNGSTGVTANSTGIRPYGSIGDIYDYQSTGIYKQTQLLVSLNTSLGRHATVFARYARGWAHNDTDGLTTLPSNPYDFSQDWGRSSLDVRNLLFVGGSITGKWGIRLSPFFVAHSGMPYNITTGTDLYGTGQTVSTARPSLVSGPGANIIDTPFGYLNVLPQASQTPIERNYATGPGFIELNLRLSKTWGFGTTKFEGMSGGSRAQQGGPPGGGGRPGGGGPPGMGGPGGGGPPGGMTSESSEHRYNLTLSIMARNALNHENLSAPIGVITSPYFPQSTGITGGFGPEAVASNQRRIDLQLRFSF